MLGAVNFSERARTNRLRRKLGKRITRLRAKRVGRCARHERELLVTLFDEPLRNNPAKHVGFVCLACGSIFTPAGSVSSPQVELAVRVPGSLTRPSRAHAARLRAVDRLNIAAVVSEHEERSAA